MNPSSSEPIPWASLAAEAEVAATCMHPYMERQPDGDVVLLTCKRCGQRGSEPRCVGVTQAGVRCQFYAPEVGGTCNKHNPLVLAQAAERSKSKAERSAEREANRAATTQRKRCPATLKNGKQCGGWKTGPMGADGVRTEPCWKHKDYGDSR